MAKHGGRRPGAGRPRISDRQLNIRVSDAAAIEIERWGEGQGHSQGLRFISEFMSGVTMLLDEDNDVHMRFHVTEDMAGRNPEVIGKELLRSLQTHGGSCQAMYAGDPHLLSVKTRIPLGNGFSLWFLVPGRRTVPPSKVDYQKDLMKIVKSLEKEGIVASIVEY